MAHWRNLYSLVTAAVIAMTVMGCGTNASVVNNGTYTTSHLTGAYAAVSKAAQHAFAESYAENTLPSYIHYRRRIYVKDTVTLKTGKVIAIDLNQDKKYGVFYAWQTNGAWKALGCGSFDKSPTQYDLSTQTTGMQQGDNVKIVVVNIPSNPNKNQIRIHSSGSSYSLKKMGDLPLWVGAIPKNVEVTVSNIQY